MVTRMVTLAAVALLSTTCGDDPPEENTGAACAAPADCYKAAEEPLKGEVMCLTRVPGGYCTHLCQMDTDCCAAKGECKSGIPQVCSPFESTNLRLCFLSCEDTVLGGKDANVYCQENAHKSFICRSTGGGSQNRKVCVPNA